MPRIAKVAPAGLEGPQILIKNPLARHQEKWVYQRTSDTCKNSIKKAFFLRNVSLGGKWMRSVGARPTGSVGGRADGGQEFGQIVTERSGERVSERQRATPPTNRQRADRRSFLSFLPCHPPIQYVSARSVQVAAQSVRLTRRSRPPIL